MNLRKLYFLLMLFCFFSACKKDEDTIVKPTNLTIEANVSVDGSGIVDFISLANNAAYYNYYYGVSSTEAPVKSVDGKSSYQYSASGDYVVKVEAFSSTNQSIIATKEVTVQVAEIVPENLTISASVSTDGSGLVTFTATANKADYYNYYFGVSDNETPTKSMDGKATYTYSASGTYTVKVEAVASSSKSISTTKEITVDASGFSSPSSYSGMNLVWQDEFDGASLNSTDWSFETGTGSNGWGNNELQYYRQENTTVSGGNLIITANKESFGGKNYTSSRMTTQGKQSFKYGRIDIRAKLPKGKGLWPALWMLGSNFSTVGWPSCGEIDIMEMVGGSSGDNTVHGTVHWYANTSVPHASYGGEVTLSSGIFADKYHVFSLVWDQSTIKWLLDDKQYHVIDITPAELSEFQSDFFFIFNVAVGGSWPGSPDATTSFPQTMMVDYVRVFQQP